MAIQSPVQQSFAVGPQRISPSSHKNTNAVKQIYVNEQIKAPKIMVVWIDGENLGVMPRLQALRLAQQDWYDLMQLSYNAQEMLCTAKLINDVGKYLYDKQKDDKVKKKQQKQVSKWFKEIKMSYGIWDNDFQLKLKKIEELLQEWFSVKCIVRLKWRERSFASKVVEQLLVIQQSVSNIARSQYPQPKIENSWVSLILLPKK